MPHTNKQAILHQPQPQHVVGMGMSQQQRHHPHQMMMPPSSLSLPLHSLRTSPPLSSNASVNGASTSTPTGTIEVFVGNLSYFCEEKDLYTLFNEYFAVNHVRIMKNEDRTRSLMYGFVTANSLQEAQEMTRLLNGHLFMGRHLK